jgi:hypothetical protein
MPGSTFLFLSCPTLASQSETCHLLFVFNVPTHAVPAHEKLPSHTRATVLSKWLVMAPLVLVTRTVLKLASLGRSETLELSHNSDARSDMALQGWCFGALVLWCFGALVFRGCSAPFISWSAKIMCTCFSNTQLNSSTTFDTNLPISYWVTKHICWKKNAHLE